MVLSRDSRRRPASCSGACCMVQWKARGLWAWPSDSYDPSIGSSAACYCRTAKIVLGLILFRCWCARYVSAWPLSLWRLPAARAVSTMIQRMEHPACLSVCLFVCVSVLPVPVFVTGIVLLPLATTGGGGRHTTRAPSPLPRPRGHKRPRWNEQATMRA